MGAKIEMLTGWYDKDNSNELERIDKIIASAVASVEIEGGKVPEEAKEMIKKHFLGEISNEDYIDWVIKRCKT